MNFSALTQKSLSLFAAVGGWRTVAEGVASKTLFLIVYLLTDHVTTSALVAVGGVLVFAVARFWTDRKVWQALIPLVIVTLSAVLAGSTGHGVDFYLSGVVMSAGAGAVVLVSMLVRWPVIGLAVGAVRGERFGWRRDRVRLRRYQACTGIFLAKFVVSTAVQLPLYLEGQVVALGIASTLVNTPAMGICAYLCWRILRVEADLFTGRTSG
ncbi:DUF3159 domain-containing protein [Kibdelosporangium persicum]|uniref:CONSERVED INTEGRAL MEMBRANE ALANINE AND LEUCINE RICH PROTEIN n=1 Tax=Kibdelosporangium persicum TaxID=2698649 RepID=A0ABX2FE02_9PSEU|nr:DUF3159 domain-containing protein [Kibdelosporangium persicum]NRN69604.1 putative CONSERVED INTEGRAL MEMBRANE ALANINE AND LEUCINE RICH PROTEIN [Kibdelosporangium persicum]